MTQTRIQEFKAKYKKARNVEITGLNTKEDMLSAFKKLFGRDPVDNEDAQYSTDMWGFITNILEFDEGYKMKRRRENKEYVFDNAVVTDGTSISIQIIESSKFKKKIKKMNKRKPKKPKKPKAGTKVEEIQEVIPILEDVKDIANDPGKGDILAMTDGITNIRYTKGMRKQDTLLLTRTNETLKRRRKSGLEVFESEILSGTRKNSCVYINFVTYILTRLEKEKEMKQVYERPVFRQFKYLVYCKQKSSEGKFIDKVKKTFCKPNMTLFHPITNPKGKKISCATKDMLTNAAKNAKEIRIGWGNWGRNPNLKYSSPTPGIGIRRRFEPYFKIHTVNEYLTSQTCPCCRNTRCLENPRLESTSYSRWWNRNVLGSFNILDIFLRKRTS